MSSFSLKNKIIIISGGAVLLGKMHVDAILQAQGMPIILDIDQQSLEDLKKQYSEKVETYVCDICDEEELQNVLKKINICDGLINNAAIDPKFDNENDKHEKSQLEFFPLDQWEKEMKVGLTGAFLCAKVFGSFMAKQKHGVIVNVSSDLGVIAPDQRLYFKDGVDKGSQPKKPVTYSVIKHGLIGLTKYLATYWADQGVRCNALAPSGVFNQHSDDFVQRISQLIPMGRMAQKEEYQASIVFLLSQASSYMTGSTLVVDGGRSCW